MIEHFLLKPVLIFLAGGIVAFAAIQFFNDPTSFAVLGEKFFGEDIQKEADSEIKKGQEQVDEAVNSLSVQSLLGKVLPALSENPALAPMIETTREVEEAVNAVMSLPDEQRNSICSQICEY
tara:strand:- start:2067 stop:2432 length:366 start_codon:yes stop_codon:yes gene_type:complete